MDINPGINRFEAPDLEAARCQVAQEGYTSFVLPDTGVFDRASFFDAVRVTFPLDPPLLGSRSWDALSDSLWEGLYRHPARRIAIIWPSTHQMAKGAPLEFNAALNVLEDVAHSLADPQATRDHSKEVAILVGR